MLQLCERRLIHRGAKFDFEQVELRSPDGRTILKREVVRHPGAVCILPLLDHGSARPLVVMIRNQRVALGREIWELPAGTLEPPEPPDRCAVRELEEETGYVPATVVPLGRFYTTPGMTDELMHAFLATDLTERAQSLQADESIRVEVVPAAEALSMIDRGDLMDAKSMLTLLLAQRRGVFGDRP